MLFLKRLFPRYVPDVLVMCVMCMYVWNDSAATAHALHALAGPRRHAKAPARRRHHIPRLVRNQAFHTYHPCVLLLEFVFAGKFRMLTESPLCCRVTPTTNEARGGLPPISSIVCTPHAPPLPLLVLLSGWPYPVDWMSFSQVCSGSPTRWPWING